jgi:hypothetical protein
MGEWEIIFRIASKHTHAKFHTLLPHGTEGPASSFTSVLGLTISCPDLFAFYIGSENKSLHLLQIGHGRFLSRPFKYIIRNHYLGAMRFIQYRKRC